MAQVCPHGSSTRHSLDGQGELSEFRLACQYIRDLELLVKCKGEFSDATGRANPVYKHVRPRLA